MNKNHFPFSNGLNIFELEIPSNLKSIRCEFFESEWGITNELLCYYQDVLIGQVTEVSFKTPVHQGLGIKTTFLNLLPMLKRDRKYNWASRKEFTRALTQILSGSFSWYLRCEHNCDQKEIYKIEDNLSLTLHELEKALGFCAGEGVGYPNFMAVHNANSNPTLE